MTSKLKCPFCGDDLRLHEDYVYDLFACSHPTCEKSARMYGTEELWQALIQAKQDLEIAKSDIEDYKKHKALWEQIRNNTILELERKLEIATRALKQIVCADKDGKPLKGVVSCWLYGRTG